MMQPSSQEREKRIKRITRLCDGILFVLLMGVVACLITMSADNLKIEIVKNSSTLVDKNPGLEKRKTCTFKVNDGQHGVDVWVNDVLLGQTPLEIPVEEIKKQVQPWNHEPNDYSVYSSALSNKLNPLHYKASMIFCSGGPGWKRMSTLGEGYYLRYDWRGTLDAVSSYRHSQKGGPDKAELKHGVGLSYTGRKILIAQLLDRARANNYQVSNAWLEATDGLGIDAIFDVMHAAYLDAFGLRAQYYQKLENWLVTEPEMLSVLKQWVRWKYGYRDEMEATQVFEMVLTILSDAEERATFDTMPVYVWALRWLTPQVDAQAMVSYLTSFVRSPGFDRACIDYWPTRVQSSTLIDFLKLDLMVYLDQYLDQQEKDETNIVEEQLVWEILMKPEPQLSYDALKVAVLIDHPGMEDYISKWYYKTKDVPDAYQRSHIRRSSQRSAWPAINPWLYLGAHLRGKAGVRFRQEHHYALLDMLKNYPYYPNNYHLITDFNPLSFVQVELWDAQGTVSSTLMSQLITYLAPDQLEKNSFSSKLWVLWPDLIRMGPMADPSLYRLWWTTIEDNISTSAYRDKLYDLILLPPSPRRDILEALLQATQEEGLSYANRGGDRDLIEVNNVKDRIEALLDLISLEQSIKPEQDVKRIIHNGFYLRFKGSGEFDMLIYKLPGLPIFAPLSQYEDLEMRKVAIKLCGIHPTPQARSILEALLEDSDPNVAALAQQCMKHIDILAFQPLDRLLEKDFEPPASLRQMVVRQYEVGKSGYQRLEVPHNLTWRLSYSVIGQPYWKIDTSSRVGGLLYPSEYSPLFQCLSQLPEDKIYVIDPNDQSPDVRTVTQNFCRVWIGKADRSKLETSGQLKKTICIYDYKREPIQCAQVTLRIKHEKTGEMLDIEGHVTDAQGQIPIAKITGEYELDCLIISHPDYGMVVRHWGWTGKQYELVEGGLIMPGSEAARRKIFGFVVDDQNEPVGGASIVIDRIKTEDGSVKRCKEVKAITDDKGYFEVCPYEENIPSLLSPAEYEIEIRTPVRNINEKLFHRGFHPNGQELTIHLKPLRRR